MTAIDQHSRLLAKAAELTGVHENTALLRRGLQTLIRVESARRLAALRGTDKAATSAPRRRSSAGTESSVIEALPPFGSR